ncbi:hypothetical protein [Rhodoferax sp. BAB1]|uniref:hypothetical protein n=1 Tax=Rhodoferax sp. BAB1 TaxID=2741720 RepID=UPI0015768427|nr:hypothetical protein [Rhodoferax sp. BAB1]QKO21167.1 hypothetical protein HTY51_04365 [Rhodoferax sp. BAB1]
MNIELKDFLLQAGVAVTFVLGLVNLYFNVKTSKRTSFINTVTSERVKWIGKIRTDIAELCALCDQWILHPNHQPLPDLHREMERLKNQIRLQLNPNDPEDQNIERLLDQLPSWTQSSTLEDYLMLQASLVSATQAMLKREWDKVKDEALHGDLRGYASKNRQE